MDRVFIYKQKASEMTKDLKQFLSRASFVVAKNMFTGLRLYIS